jgi:hypothetical protein
MPTLFLIERHGMTAVDVCFKYGTAPGELEAQALNSAREIYGIRKITFAEKNQTVRVEYDATRFDDTTVANLLRRAGLDLKEKVELV